MWEVESVGVDVPTMEVNGNVSELTAGDDLKEVVLATAREAGYGKFRFFIDDEEVLPQNAPSVIEAGRAYKVTPYDVAG